MAAPIATSGLELLPERSARERLAPARMRIVMAVPDLPSLGIGLLRVLRVRERDDGYELVVGYEGYERLSR